MPDPKATDPKRWEALVFDACHEIHMRWGCASFDDPDEPQEQLDEALVRETAEAILRPIAAEVDVLRSALRPFAGCDTTEDGAPRADDDWPPTTERIKDWLSWDDFRAAVAALKASDDA